MGIEELNIAKINIKINLIKILSLWGSSLFVVWKISGMYSDFKNTYSYQIRELNQCKSDIKELKDWRDKVTAYYIPTNKQTEKILNKNQNN